LEGIFNSVKSAVSSGQVLGLQVGRIGIVPPKVKGALELEVHLSSAEAHGDYSQARGLTPS
jgi:hypothetical protein